MTRNELLVAVAAVLAVAAAVVLIAYAVWHTGRTREADFSADIAETPPTDLAQLVCREIGGFETGFDASRAVAAGPGGEWLVSGDFAVRAFDANGRQVREVPVAEPPGPLAADANGTLYVATRDRVFVFDPNGQRRAAWASAGPAATLTSIALTPGEVLVADAGNREVRRHDRSGKLLKTIGRKDADRNIPGFVVPSPYFDVALAPDGLLRVVSPGRRRIEAYTLDGDLEGWWGKYGLSPEDFTGCCNPSNFALIGVDADAGRFAGFVTSEKGTTRVKLYDARGGFVGIVAGHESFARHDQVLSGRPAGQPFAALDVAVDAAGRIAVLDPVLNRVRLYRRLEPTTRPAGAKK